jgi:3-dehydroquinate synthase
MLTLPISLNERTYSIHIKRGIMSELGKKIKKVFTAGKVAVITDKNVGALYGKEILGILDLEGFKPHLIAVEPGEKSKSIETLVRVYMELINCNITRSDIIVTLGGGVVGDLGGFAAATFLRGVPYIQVPTSLIAQIDSSVGGKVAVDMIEGKNLIGSFYQPIAVFIDPNFLDTLEERFFNDGMAEVIKYAFIKDRQMFERLMEYNREELLDNIENIIFTCLNIKKTFVEKDERDFGLRKMLNFGHTLGHAVEKYFSYGKYSHGEAISIGMYCITQKSEQIGMTEVGTGQKLKQLLKKYGLPYEMPENSAEIVKAIFVDKKSRGDKIDIVLLRTIGECFIKKFHRVEVPAFFL